MNVSCCGCGCGFGLFLVFSAIVGIAELLGAQATVAILLTVTALIMSRAYIKMKGIA